MPFLLAGVLLGFFPGLCSGEGRRIYGDLDGVIYLGNYDGDTVRFDIPGVHPLLGDNISVRICGVDTPELRARCAQEKEQAMRAKEMVRDLLRNSGHIVLKDVGRDKYFRIVARVVADGVDVGERLLQEGLAVPYEGGRKSGWCQTE
ncbi:MAG: thermonuclease family protein [Magnetococcales bacterium]|nr:thermonuclease family protein [Magnetococcales bacterium]